MRTENLYCDNVLSQPVDFDFSDGYGEVWWPVAPDFHAWTAEQCVSFCDDYGQHDDVCLPGDGSRAQIITELESIGIGLDGDESTELLTEAYWDSVTAGDLGDIYAMRAACCEIWDCGELATPMMNYYYPITLRGDDAEAAEKLLTDGPCLTLVHFLKDSIGHDRQYPDYALALTGGGMDLSAEICKAYILLGQRPPVHFCDLPRMSGRKYPKEFLEACAESCRVAMRWHENTLSSLHSLAGDPDYSAEPFYLPGPSLVAFR